MKTETRSDRRSELGPLGPGRCEYCKDYAMICLNGQRFLCWDHYCEEMETWNDQRSE